MQSASSTIAHLASKYNSKDQYMDEHVSNIEKRMLTYTKNWRLKEIADYINPLSARGHDLGKFKDEFTPYMRSCASAKAAGLPKPHYVDHKRFGARAMFLHSGHPEVVRHILGTIILGHHTGIPSHTNIVREIESVADQEPAIHEALKQIDLAVPEVDMSPLFDGPNPKLHLDMFTRMLQSCLVDADHLDTERHMSPGLAAIREKSILKMADYVDVWIQRTRDIIAEKQSVMKDGPIKSARHSLGEACQRVMSGKPGFYSLNAPTGSGKTLAYVSAALTHAKINKMDRVICLIPFLNIINQTAKDMHRIIKEEGGLLEHHSNVDFGDLKNSARYKMHYDNYALPFIMTSHAQWGLTVLGNKPSNLQKLHNCSNTVFVVDEAHCLPLRMLSPCLDILRALVEDYGCTVLFVSATMPPYDGVPQYLKHLPKITPIVEDTKALFQTMSRASYLTVEGDWTWNETANSICSQGVSCLSILNTKKDSLCLMRSLRRMGQDPIHMSTLLCPAHRGKVLENIEAALAAEKQGGPKIIVVATQVVEAGVDLDFPLVHRARGPLWTAVQSGGRCDRHGERDGTGVVTIFNPSETSLTSRMSEYYSATQLTAARYSSQDIDYNDPDVMSRYFTELFNDLQAEGLDQKGIQAMRAAGDFEGVAAVGTLIDTETCQFIVPYDRAAYDSLRKTVAEVVSSQDETLRMPWQQITTNSVSVELKNLARYDASQIETVLENSLYIWLGDYDDILGLGVIPAD
jgi:CRISPR-associated endonuclease/helicase Cas3